MVTKIDTRYKIAYSKSGILQQAEFNYSNGKLINHNFSPSYQPYEDKNILEGLNDINEILLKIKGYSFANRAEITHINNLPVFFVESGLKGVVSEFENGIDTLLCKTITDFFNSNIKPIIEKRNWVITSSWVGCPIIAQRNEATDEVEDISKTDKDLLLINYLCQRIRRAIGLEVNDTDGFSDIYRYLDVKLQKD